MLQFSQFGWTLSYSVWDVFNNFLLIDATDWSKISSDQKRIFIALSLYPLSFFANTPFKMLPSICILLRECSETVFEAGFVSNNEPEAPFTRPEVSFARPEADLLVISLVPGKGLRSWMKDSVMFSHEWKSLDENGLNWMKLDLVFSILSDPWRRRFSILDPKQRINTRISNVK